MTHLGTFIILIVCLGVGYVLEPMFFSGVKPTPPKPKPESANNNPGQENPTPVKPPADPAPAPTIQVDLTKITQADFPEKVALKTPYKIADANSGVTMQLKAGTNVKPLRLEGTDLVIQPVGLPIESKINVDKTNFKELAVPKMLARLQNAVADNNPPSPTPPTDPEPAPPVPEDPEPAPASKLDEAAIVALLKKDVAAGKVTEFKADQVTAWKAGEDMEFDGETYQAGRVTFKAETILGVQEHEAIALIKDGEVYKWMWAKTKLEMR